MEINPYQEQVKDLSERGQAEVSLTSMVSKNA